MLIVKKFGGTSVGSPERQPEDKKCLLLRSSAAHQWDRPNES